MFGKRKRRRQLKPQNIRAVMYITNRTMVMNENCFSCKVTGMPVYHVLTDIPDKLSPIIQLCPSCATRVLNNHVMHEARSLRHRYVDNK